MSISDLLAGLKRSSKKEDVPGMLLKELDESCPICSKRMKLYRPCCGSPHGYKGCACGYKVILAGDSV